MTIVYKDKTFCANQNCKKRCERFLTPQIEQIARDYGLPIAVSEFICLEQGKDGKWELKQDA